MEAVQEVKQKSPPLQSPWLWLWFYRLMFAEPLLLRLLELQTFILQPYQLITGGGKKKMTECNQEKMGFLLFYFYF